jgi:hypothetical protein
MFRSIKIVDKENNDDDGNDEKMKGEISERGSKERARDISKRG